MNAQSGRPVQAVVVGAGLMGRWHMEAAVRAGAAVTAVVDREHARAKHLAARVRGATAYGGLSAALEEGTGVRVVHICTGLDSHVSLAREALNAGCHVLVEKPFVSDMAELHEILALASARKLQACPVHQFLFQRGILSGMQRVRALGSERGTIRHLEMEVASTGADAGALGRDEAVLEILPHSLAFAARLCGTGIATAEWSVQRASEGEISVGTVIGPTRIGFRISMRGRPPLNRLRLVTDSGTLEADLFNGFAVWDGSGNSRLMKLFRPIRSAAATAAAASTNLLGRALRAETAYPGLRELVRRFYGACANEAPSPIGTEETLAVTAAWTTLRRLLDTPTDHARLM